MDGFKLPHDQSHFKEAVYFLPLNSQKFLLIILWTLDRWRAEVTLEPPSGFELGTPGLGIKHPKTICMLKNIYKTRFCDKDF